MSMERKDEMKKLPKPPYTAEFRELAVTDAIARVRYAVLDESQGERPG